MDILEKMLAGFIERTFGNYITTIVGVLAMVLEAVNVFGSSIPLQYQNYVHMAAIVIAGVALMLAKDKGLPTDNIPTPGKTSVLLLFCLLVTAMLISPAQAQSNVVGFGAAGSFNATPPIAGLGFYAKQIAGTQTYSATMCQVLPNNTKPLTVTTNCGTGIAQQAPFSIHGVTPYFILNGGIQWQGSNVGFQYSGLAILPIPLKKTGWYLGPYGGWNKGSVANGTGYQPSGGLTLLKTF